MALESVRQLKEAAETLAEFAEVEGKAAEGGRL